MAPPTRRSSPPSAVLLAKQLDSLIARFSPPIAKLTKSVLRQTRARLPGAVELIYDKSNSLYFFEGDSLPDPDGILLGNGTMVRYIRLTSAAGGVARHSTALTAIMIGRCARH